jgi:endonuclease/exonuclease/phosphatase family metal-dependent hydrolase
MYSLFRKKTLTTLLLILNFGLILSLLLAYLAPYISPAVFWPVAFFGLGFPLIVAVNLIVSFLWLFLRPRFALLSLLVILAGIKPISRQWQWHDKPGQEAKNSVTVVSFNVHDFSGLEDGAQDTAIRKEIFKFLGNAKPDILCLQDMPYYFPNRRPTLSLLARELGLKYSYTPEGQMPNSHKFSEIKLITSFPVVRSGDLSGDEDSFAVYVDLLMEKDTVRVYSVHLASTRLSGAKELLTTTGLAESGKRGIPRRIFHIIKSLKSAFIHRAYQADILKKSISLSPYPVIVCGDHNDTPLSYAIHTIRQGLNDSFVARGKGFGRTYGRSSFPLRIDYVMASPCFVFNDHNAVFTNLSDHLPLIVKISRRE